MKPPCSKIGCEDASKVAGLCDPHYWSARREAAAPCSEECGEQSEVAGLCRPCYKVMRGRTKGSPGTLYVVETDTGIVKVGKTTRGVKRILEHRASMCQWGVAMTRWWMSPMFANCHQAERRLLEVIESWGLQSLAAETFMGLSYEAAVAEVRKLLANELTESGTWSTVGRHRGGNATGPGL